MFDKEALHHSLALLGIEDPGDIFEKLAAAYGHSSRHYHTKHHVAECLKHLKPLKSLAEHPQEIDIAIWFHDAVYDTTKGDNEERSAEWAEGYLKSFNVLPETVGRIVSMIIATKSHYDLKSIDEKIMIDVDLGILGQKPGVFEIYDAAIRKEYIWVPEEQYKVGRAEILEGFLRRDRIFHTDYCYDTYEVAARQNLAKKIKQLRL